MEEGFFTSVSLNLFPYWHERHKVSRRPRVVSKTLGSTNKIK